MENKRDPRYNNTINNKISTKKLDPGAEKGWAAAFKRDAESKANKKIKEDENINFSKKDPTRKLGVAPLKKKIKEDEKIDNVKKIGKDAGKRIVKKMRQEEEEMAIKKPSKEEKKKLDKQSIKSQKKMKGKFFGEGEIPDAPKDLMDLIDKYDKSEIEKGMDVEQEHNKGETDVVQSPLDVLKIVLAHMKEDPKYYTHLKFMEDEHKIDEATMGKFTPEMLSRLKAEYSGLKTMNPSSDSYKKLISMLDNMSKDQLKQISGAKINFLSRLADNRLRKNEAFGFGRKKKKYVYDVPKKHSDELEDWLSVEGFDWESEKKGSFIRYTFTDKEAAYAAGHLGKYVKIDESTTSRDLDFTTSDQELFAGDDPFEDQEIDYPLKEAKRWVVTYKDTGGKEKSFEISAADVYRANMEAHSYASNKPDISKITKISLKESSDKFSVGQKVHYSKKDWTISSQTKDWIELEDNRGLTTIIDKDEISSFKNGVLVTENDVRITEEEVDRMKKCL